MTSQRASAREAIATIGHALAGQSQPIMFDGEAVERFAIVRPELEEARLALLIAAVEQLAS